MEPRNYSVSIDGNKIEVINKIEDIFKKCNYRDYSINNVENFIKEKLNSKYVVKNTVFGSDLKELRIVKKEDAKSGKPYWETLVYKIRIEYSYYGYSNLIVIIESMTDKRDMYNERMKGFSVNLSFVNKSNRFGYENAIGFTKYPWAKFNNNKIQYVVDNIEKEEEINKFFEYIINDVFGK